MLVHLGPPEKAEPFFSARWPEARAVSDEKEDLYEAFGLEQGSVGQLLGPRVFLAGVRAARFGVGMPVGNPLRMSGWFLIDDGAVVWSHVHEHAGAPRRVAELTAAYRSLQEASA